MNFILFSVFEIVITESVRSINVLYFSIFYLFHIITAWFYYK